MSLAFSDIFIERSQHVRTRIRQRAMRETNLPNSCLPTSDIAYRSLVQQYQASTSAPLYHDGRKRGGTGRRQRHHLAGRRFPQVNDVDPEAGGRSHSIARRDTLLIPLSSAEGESMKSVWRAGSTPLDKKASVKRHFYLCRITLSSRLVSTTALLTPLALP